MPVRVYRVAGCRFWVDARVSALEMFRDTSLKRMVLPASAVTAASHTGTQPFRDAQREVRAGIGGGGRELRCRAVGGGYVVEANAVRYFVRDDGRWIQLLHRARDETESLALLLGPILVLSLALQQRWCLHASALIQQGSALLFLGESGYGKSTIVSWWSKTHETAVRVADDIAPVIVDRDLYSLPTFPQCKLADAEQFRDPAPIRVDRLYVLKRGYGDNPVPQRLSSSAAALALARHTVAARLFPESLLEQHIKFCAQVTELKNITQITYPHTAAALPAIKAIVDEDLNRP